VASGAGDSSGTWGSSTGSDVVAPSPLVSPAAVPEHDASGSAIRVDMRRGVVLRHLAGNDPEVNEEWITDKDRFAFTWSSQPDRLTVDAFTLGDDMDGTECHDLQRGLVGLDARRRAHQEGLGRP